MPTSHFISSTTDSICTCQFWFCERTNVVQPAHPDALPRFRKWDLTRLKTALKRHDVGSIEAVQVHANPITPSKVEPISMTVPPMEQTTPQAIGSSTSHHKLPVNQQINQQQQTIGGPFSYQNHATSIPKEMEAHSSGQTHLQSKGKEKIPIGSAPTHQPSIPDLMPQSMWNTVHEEQLTDLKTKLVNAVNAAESWRLRHVSEVEKTKSLEATIEILTGDNTALQATIQLLESEQTHLQTQLSNQQGPSTYPVNIKDIHIPGTEPTPDNGTRQFHFTEPSFDLGFSTNENTPNLCQTITCYKKPISPLPQQQDPNAHIKTHSQQPYVSPPPPSAQFKLARNYKQFQPFKDLSPHHQQLVEHLATRTDLQGYYTSIHHCRFFCLM